ncbi:MAG: response regulator [Gemmatimonadota bacterium]
MPLTLLIVDDEPLVRRLTCSLASRLGYEALPAADGEEALRLFHAHAGTITALVLDQSMPGMLGLELALRIRALDVNVPILLATGLASPELQAVAADDARMGVLEKPYTKEHLMRVLERMIHPPSENGDSAEGSDLK